MTDIDLLQDIIVARLNSLRYFRTVPVTAYQPLSTKGDRKTNEVAQAEFWRIKKDGVHSGGGVLVPPADMRVPNPNLPGPQYEPSFRIRCAEQPLVSELAETGLNPNGTAGFGVTEISRQVARGLHLWSPDGVVMLYVVSDVLDQQDVRLRSRMVTVQLTAWSEDEPSRVPSVQLSIHDGYCTMSIPADSEVWFTLDGTAPLRQSPAAQYTAPIAVTAGQTIWAGAYDDYRDGSDWIKITV